MRSSVAGVAGRRRWSGRPQISPQASVQRCAGKVGEQAHGDSEASVACRLRARCYHPAAEGKGGPSSKSAGPSAAHLRLWGMQLVQGGPDAGVFRSFTRSGASVLRDFPSRPRRPQSPNLSQPGRPSNSDRRRTPLCTPPHISRQSSGRSCPEGHRSAPSRFTELLVWQLRGFDGSG